MGAYTFRAVDHWLGAATFESGGSEHRLPQLFVTVVGYFEAGDDGIEIDTGERVWSARAGHVPAPVGGEVVVTLEGGKSTPARVGYDGTLLGDGVPSPLDARPAVTRGR